MYLVDQVRERMDFVETCEAMRGMGKKWPEAVLKLVEDAANGPAVISALQKDVEGIVAVKPGGGKLSRAQAVLPLIEAGNVLLPAGAVWVRDFVAECSAFPVGRHDDQVDAMSHALMRFLPVAREKAVAKEKAGVGDLEKQIQGMMRGRGGGAWIRPTMR